MTAQEGRRGSQEALLGVLRGHAPRGARATWATDHRCWTPPARQLRDSIEYLTDKLLKNKNAQCNDKRGFLGARALALAPPPPPARLRQQLGGRRVQALQAPPLRRHLRHPAYPAHPAHGLSGQHLASSQEVFSLLQSERDLDKCQLARVRQYASTVDRAEELGCTSALREALLPHAPNQGQCGAS